MDDEPALADGDHGGCGADDSVVWLVRLLCLLVALEKTVQAREKRISTRADARGLSEII